MNVKIAAAQYDISFLESWADYQQKSKNWVKHELWIVVNCYTFA